MISPMFQSFSLFRSERSRTSHRPIETSSKRSKPWAKSLCSFRFRQSIQPAISFIFRRVWIRIRSCNGCVRISNISRTGTSVITSRSLRSRSRSRCRSSTLLRFSLKRRTIPVFSVQTGFIRILKAINLLPRLSKTI